MAKQPTTQPQGIPLRGPSGRLYGYLDVRNMIIEVKRKNDPVELIDLKPLLQQDAKPPS